MWQSIWGEKSARVAVLFFVIYSYWFLNLQQNPENIEQYDLFTVSYGLMALWGAIWGFQIAKRWGWVRSVMGKSLIFFASGLGFQELGQLTYSYYIYVLNIEVPYPSFGDIFYYGSIIFYILGVLYLAKASGVQVSLKSVKGKINALLIPIVILLLSYYVFLQGYEFDWSQFLTIILDFGYPLGQAIYVSLAFLIYLLTRGVLGGLMRPKILFVLVALLAQYLADWTFLYQASRGTWSVSGINDYMYFFAYFLMALALIQFDTVYKKLHEKK